MNLEPGDHSSDADGSSLRASAPYELSIASSAPSSQSSVFSDSLSAQSSIASSISDDFRSSHEDARERDRICAQAQLCQQARSHSLNTEEHTTIGNPLKDAERPNAPSYADVTSATVQQGQHPRRCSVLKCQKPPPLVRQSDRKISFVENLVDCATQTVDVIWPLSDVLCGNDRKSRRGVLPLRKYIEETLRRSRTSYSTLQVALYYLVLIMPHVPKSDVIKEQSRHCSVMPVLMCGRRTFLSALILASKYLQDRNYSAKAWSKMSGLPTGEINANERVILEKINWKLHIPKPLYESWQELILGYTPQPPSSPGIGLTLCKSTWKAIVPLLTPELDALPGFARKSSPAEVLPTNSFVTSPTTPMPSLKAPRRLDTESGSHETTPTPATVLPSYLEPRTDVLPPAPPLARMGPLPTPQMTPSSVASSTPAASACDSRRSSMCSATAVAQQTSFSRCVLDVPGGDTHYSGSRRPSLSSTLSLVSSPESMLSDNSRALRSSSISSISTAPTKSVMAPQRSSLARLATCRNVRLPPFERAQEASEEGTASKPIVIGDDVEMVSSPDMADFSISEKVLNTPHRHSKNAPHIAPASSADKGRKRGRPRGGHHRRSELQEEVRLLLQESQEDDLMDVDVQVDYLPPAVGYAGKMLADSNPAMATREAQPPASLSRPESGRVPVLRPDGKKRACVSSNGAAPPRLYREVME